MEVNRAEKEEKRYVAEMIVPAEASKRERVIQANAQKELRNLTIEDGWVYFIHGWTRVIAEVFNVFIPTEGPEFDKLSEIAASTRK